MGAAVEHLALEHAVVERGQVARISKKVLAVALTVVPALTGAPDLTAALTLTAVLALIAVAASTAVAISAALAILAMDAVTTDTFAIVSSSSIHFITDTVTGFGYGYPGYDAYYMQPGYDDGAYAGENYSTEVDVQVALAGRGYYKGRIDGVIGAGTRRAVRAFQRDAGLPVTGRIDARLLNALRAS